MDVMEHSVPPAVAPAPTPLPPASPLTRQHVAATMSAFGAAWTAADARRLASLFSNSSTAAFIPVPFLSTAAWRGQDRVHDYWHQRFAAHTYG